MDTVVRFSLRQKVFLNLMFVILMVAGAYALFDLPTERYPNVNLGKVIISTSFPGASPQEVEKLVTHEIEEALESVEEIEWIKATSFRERSLIQLKFLDDANYEALFDEVRFTILNRMQELPAGIDPPEINDIRINDFLPVIVVNLAGDQDNRAISLMAEELKIALLQIPGVQEVKTMGEFEREFHVYLDPVKLRSLGICFAEVAGALSLRNLSIPAGDFSNNSGEFVVKVDERFHTRKEVVSTIIRKDADGSFVRVADVISRAGKGYRDPLVISSVNGENAVALQVIKGWDGNALDIKAAVERKVENFAPVVRREGITLTLTQDSIVPIRDGLDTLTMNMLLGIFLVSFIVWYFMGLRNAALVTVGVPFSFLLSMLLINFTGNSLNEMTLFSLVLMTGIIVDDAIVVTENIYRHLQEGKPLQQAIVDGTAEVGLPVISATLTTVAAFLPMLIMTGSTGEFFALIPKAVSFAIVASLIECLLILPVHYFDFGQRAVCGTPEAHQSGPHGPRWKLLLAPATDTSGSVPVRSHRSEEEDNLLLKVLRSLTVRILDLTLRFRFSSIALVLLAFVAAALILGVSVTGRVPLIRIQFFPDDYTFYHVNVEGPSDTPVEQIDHFVKRIARFVMADGPGMARSAAAFAGFYTNEDYEWIYGNQYGSVMVTLPSKENQTFASPLTHLERMRERLNAAFAKDGLRLRIHAQKEGPPQGKAITVRVVGSDLSAIDGLADALLHFLRSSPEIAPYLIELDDDRGRPKRVFQLALRHERIHEYDLDSKQVAELAASVLDGRYQGRFRLADEEVDLKLYIDPSFMATPEDALTIPLVEHPSGPIRLGDLVRVRTYLEAGELNRYRGQRSITLQANIKPGAPTSTPAVVNAIRDYYETVRGRYPGATVTFGGEFEDTQRSYESLAYAFLIAVLIIYIILATQFQSYLQPLIILSAIVFALIGVVFGKLATQSLFTVNSFIAVIGVTGVVVNDALVLIDFINKRYRSGLSRREAIEEGVRVRLRPIVLTTLTTTLGLLPMALGIPSYSLVWGTMASTFVTGLAAATTLTVFIVPVLWDLLQQWQEQRDTRKGLA
jgi:multidrug efflux pump subunit AcrB